MSFFSASEGSFSSYFLKHSRRTPLPVLTYHRPPPRNLSRQSVDHVNSNPRSRTPPTQAEVVSREQLETGLTRAQLHSATCLEQGAASGRTIRRPSACIGQRLRQPVTPKSRARPYSTFAFDEWVPRVVRRGSAPERPAPTTQVSPSEDDWPMPPTEQQRLEALRMLDDCFLRPPIIDRESRDSALKDAQAGGAESVAELHAASLGSAAGAREEFYTPSYIRGTTQKVRRLVVLVQPDYTTVSHKDIFDAYLAIPEPRPLRIPEKSRRRLLGHLSIVRQKSEESLMRFLTVIGDYRSAGIEIGVREWSTAINLTAKAIKPINAASVSSALQMWREMETDAGIPGNMVTFNILFDAAAKAGKFILAQTILREMEHRKLDFDLISHTSKIYYEGLRRSTKGVYDAYDALVEAGEVVDTTVISALIAALIKCGDPVAAERVFDRAKQWHADHEGGPLPLPRETWSQRRQQARMFVRTKGRRSRRPPVKAPLAPGYHAYRELVGYYAIAAGNVDRALGLVDEMILLYKMRVGGQIYMRLFHGFAKHGGTRYSSWTAELLEQVFEHLVAGVTKDSEMAAVAKSNIQAFQHQNAVVEDEDGDQTQQQLEISPVTAEERLYIGQNLLLLCVKAFLKCTNLDRTQEVCHILSGFVEPNEELNMRIDELLEAREAEDDSLIDKRNDAME